MYQEELVLYSFLLSLLTNFFTGTSIVAVEPMGGRGEESEEERDYHICIVSLPPSLGKDGI